MRSMAVDIGGLSLELGATFGAAREVSEKVADPLAIAREALLESQIGPSVYQPRFSFTVRNIPLILWIGAKAGGFKGKLEEIEAACFDAGMMECKVHAFNFIMALSTPRSTEIAQADAPKDADAGN